MDWLAVKKMIRSHLKASKLADHLKNTIFTRHSATKKCMVTPNIGCIDVDATGWSRNEKPNKEKIATVYSNADRKFILIHPPAVLILHLKCFEQNVKQGWKKFLYFLDGVVEQSVNLMGGHYTAKHQHSAPRPTSSVVIRFVTEYVNQRMSSKWEIRRRGGRK